VRPKSERLMRRSLRHPVEVPVVVEEEARGEVEMDFWLGEVDSET
jgi:hypothetical protein